MIKLPDGRMAGFISESGSPEPESLTPIDDRTRAVVALRMLQAGDALLWTGDYLNGRALLQALRRRLNAARQGTARGRGSSESGPTDLASRWRIERSRVRESGELLGNITVLLEPSGELLLRRAPETEGAVTLAWGASDIPRVVGLNTLGGALSAAEWTKKGLDVPGLEGRITPRFGVFSPTRRAYVDLLEHLDVGGCSVLDVGCGTGVLAFVLLQRGAASAVGTDMEERAVLCARDNAVDLGLNDRFRAAQSDLFPVGERFDRIIFNAPWVPETPRTALDRAVFDEGGHTLRRFLSGAVDHLAPNGEVALIVSDLPIRLGLREPGALDASIADAGLRVLELVTVGASHQRATEPSDALHAARSAERIQLYRLGPLGLE